MDEQVYQKIQMSVGVWPFIGNVFWIGLFGSIRLWQGTLSEHTHTHTFSSRLLGKSSFKRLIFKVYNSNFKHVCRRKRLEQIFNQIDIDGIGVCARECGMNHIFHAIEILSSSTHQFVSECVWAAERVFKRYTIELKAETATTTLWQEEINQRLLASWEFSK